MAGIAPGRNVTTSINQTSNRNYTVPLIIITTLFFLFGFVTNINDILIPHLKRACQLTDFQSAFVQFAFFGAYFLVSLPAGAILKKTGYKNGIVIGLLTCAVGALLFIPAAQTRQYLFFLFALSVLASGITLLQVAANPYVSILGPAHKAASRLSLMGAFNSLAGTLAPLIGGYLFLKGAEYTMEQIAAMPQIQRIAYLDAEAALVIKPYLGLAGILFGLALMVYFANMPTIEGLADENETATEKAEVEKESVFQYRHLVLGIVAIFVYVGAEVAVGSFLIRYGQSLGIPGFTELMGSKFVSYYWGSAMIGRFIGIVAMSRISFSKALAFNSIIAIVLVLVSISSEGRFALWCMVLVGLCNSIMWPVIFPLAIKGLGRHTKQGSSLLIMAVVGGAIVPLLVGFLSDKIGIQSAFLVTVACYAYLLFYGLVGYKTPSEVSLVNK